MRRAVFVEVCHARVPDPHAVCLGFKSDPFERARGFGAERDVSPTVTAKFDGAVCFGINANGVTKTAQMPCREECAETLAVRHQGGVIVPDVAAAAAEKAAVTRFQLSDRERGIICLIDACVAREVRGE